MASSSHKKHRSGKRPEPDSPRKFVSAKAEEAYRSQILPKSIIAERGIDKPFGDIHRQIRERGWFQFVRSPSVASVGLVREFYANAVDRRSDNTVFVRGKWVSFASETINALYQLPNAEYDQYTGLQASSVDYRHILSSLTQGGAEVNWKWTGSVPTNFPASGLDATSKVWHHFISARLLPSGNLSEVTRERAVLNFAIQRSYSIDVGKLIAQSLLRTFQAKASVSLGHPSVIHDLCVAHDVVIHPTEETVPPKAPIKGMGNIFPGDLLEGDPAESPSRSRSGPAPHPRGRNLTMNERMDLLSEDCRELKVDVRDIKTRLTRQEKQQQFYNEQSVVYQQYMVDYHHHHASTSASPGRGGYPDPPPRFTNYRGEEEEEGEGEQEEEEEEEEEGED